MSVIFDIRTNTVKNETFVFSKKKSPILCGFYSSQENWNSSFENTFSLSFPFLFFPLVGNDFSHREIFSSLFFKDIFILRFRMPATVFIGDIAEDTRRDDIEDFLEKSKYARGERTIFGKSILKVVFRSVRWNSNEKTLWFCGFSIFSRCWWLYSGMKALIF